MGSDGVAVVDISDPANPELLRSVSPTSSSQAALVSGTHLFVAEDLDAGLDVFRIVSDCSVFSDGFESGGVTVWSCSAGLKWPCFRIAGACMGRPQPCLPATEASQKSMSPRRSSRSAVSEPVFSTMRSERQVEFPAPGRWATAGPCRMGGPFPGFRRFYE